MIPQDHALVAVPDLLDGHRRRADHSARHDQDVAWQLVQVHQLGRPELLHRLHRLQQSDPRVPAPAGAEHGAAAGERPQGRFVK